MKQTFLALAIWSLIITVLLLAAYGKLVQGVAIFLGVAFIIFISLWLISGRTFSYSPKLTMTTRDICPIDFFTSTAPTSVRSRLSGRTGLKHTYPDDDMSIRRKRSRKAVVKLTI